MAVRGVVGIESERRLPARQVGLIPHRQGYPLVDTRYATPVSVAVCWPTAGSGRPHAGNPMRRLT
ncbi:hypothetical protein FRAHR75_480027 [Frankia sp. Hr75.2]|nr:hypothetical protein FRAHR75_480027 [Frankia sp. Hr75.2]